MQFSVALALSHLATMAHTALEINMEMVVEGKGLSQRPIHRSASKSLLFHKAPSCGDAKAGR